MPKRPAAASGLDSESYRALMRHQAGAVSVIAAGAAPHRAGLTATAVSSLSDNPPTLLVCVQRKAGAHDVIAQSKAFSVNLLAADQHEVAERFAGRTRVKGEARFAGLDWASLTTGAPILAGALASLDCELIDQHSFSTHTVFLGRVVAGRFRAEAAPLLYFRNDYWDIRERK